MRKGQVFIVFSIIFSSLILLTAFSYQQITFTDGDSEMQFYFETALNKQAEIFNQELREIYTVENIKQGIYSYNSFVKTQSNSKGIEYSGFQMLFLPERNSTLVINYRDQSTEFSYHSGSWTNQSIAPNQNLVIKGKKNPRVLEVEELDISERFNASKPTILGHMEMRSESETWRNYILR